MKHFTATALTATLIMLAVFNSGMAAGSELTLSTGGGIENNVFYSSADRKASAYALLELAYQETLPLSQSGWDFTFDGFYSGKIFLSETAANDHFVSLFMDLNRDFESWEIGVSNDPQFTRFVTSDTSVGLVSVGKQRVLSDKTRVYAIFDISDSSEIEGGVAFRVRNYRDSDSDYGEVSFDTVYRRRVSASTRLNLGVIYDRRDFGDRLAVDSITGNEVQGETLKIRRVRPFIKVLYSPDRKKRFSLKYRYKSNVDTFQNWFSYKESSFLGEAEYLFSDKNSVDASVRLDIREYDKQTGDFGGILGEKITSTKIRFLTPAGIVPDGSWFISLDYSGFRSDKKSFEYDNTSLLLGLTIKR